MDSERHNWIVNTRVLYDFISCIKLPQQPLCVDFTQTIAEYESEGLCLLQIACGLQTESHEDVSIYLIDVTLPSEPLKEELRRYSKCLDYEGFPLPSRSNEPMYQCVHQLKFNEDVNRLLSNRDNDGSVLLAAKSTNVHLFDLNRLSEGSEHLEPVITFKGHTSEGYGLSFNKDSTRLASCSDDKLTLIYDIAHPDPVYTYTHETGLNCVDFAKHGENYCLVATEDGYVLLIDLRQPGLANKTKSIQCAENAIATNHLNTNVFASGTTEGVVYLWDHRNLKDPVHEIKAHDDPIVRLHFNDISQTLIASASENSNLYVFDLDAAGKDIEGHDLVEEDEADDIPSELIFTHTGHQEKIYDFAWSLYKDLDTLIASVGEDYSLQLWQMTSDVVDESSEDE